MDSFFQFQGVWAWFVPTTICGIIIISAGFLTLLQPETKNRGLEDHVKQETTCTANELELVK
jgi:hypothetical protein